MNNIPSTSYIVDMRYKLQPLTYLIVSTLCIVFDTSGQNIHPLEPSRSHYTTLAAINKAPNSTGDPMDNISYPMAGRATGQQFIGLKPTYLSSADVEELKSLRTFPANSSQQTRAELDYLLDWQNKRDRKQKARALEIARVGYWPPMSKDSEGYGNVEALFWECQSIVGTHCNPDNYPKTMHLLAGVTRDARIMEFTIKYHLKRPRPYHLEPDLEPMGRVSNPSFASGHTLWAYIQAFTWSELIPDQRKQFLDIAYEVGASREIMGIHYPSDEEAARVIAHQMLVFMLDNDQFIQALNEAKKEWNQ